MSATTIFPAAAAARTCPAQGDPLTTEHAQTLRTAAGDMEETTIDTLGRTMGIRVQVS